jgi:hypothetical protein
MANRAELEQAIREGCTVDVHGTSYKNVKELPPNPADGSELEGTVTYDAQGRLTREGMELAIKRGGSVLHEDRPVNDLEALPTAADLAQQEEPPRPAPPPAFRPPEGQDKADEGRRERKPRA